ncbi:hypothetical protein COOONC_27972, partial [Cooperia oncophora]
LETTFFFLSNSKILFQTSVKSAASDASHKAHEVGKPAEGATSEAIAEAKSALTEACDAIQERATAIVEEVKRVADPSPESPEKVPGPIADGIAKTVTEEAVMEAAKEQAASSKVAGAVDEVAGAEVPEVGRFGRGAPLVLSIDQV